MELLGVIINGYQVNSITLSMDRDGWYYAAATLVKDGKYFAHPDGGTSILSSHINPGGQSKARTLYLVHDSLKKNIEHLIALHG